MPADPIHPDQLGGQALFRADLATYLDSLPIGELAELLGELPSSRQQPLQLGVLMVALNERLPDSYKLLPPAGRAARAGARPAGPGARPRARGRLQRQLAGLPGARRAHPPDLRLDGAAAVTARRALAAARRRPRPGGRPAAGSVAPLAG